MYSTETFFKHICKLNLPRTQIRSHQVWETALTPEIAILKTCFSFIQHFPTVLNF